MARLRLIRGSATIVELTLSHLRKRVLEAVLILCVVVFAAGLIAAWWMGRPQGQPTPQAVVSLYLQALEDADADGIESLVSSELDAEREAAEYVRAWSRIPPHEASVSFEESTLGKVQYAHIRFNSRPGEALKLHLVRLHDGWYLALGVPREQVPDFTGTPIRD